ncbi:hypothetical protein L7F22_023482 [Adiantum nelumboides]|nr:hypothetical protein [Adiantum nelumboides]
MGTLFYCFVELCAVLEGSLTRKNNGLEGLARGIRIYFLHHDLAQIVVKGKGPGMPIEDVIHDLEELTGGVLVSREANKIIMYRGWPKGFSFPFAQSLGIVTPELLSAIEAEKDWEDDSSREDTISGETESDYDSEQEDNKEPVDAITHVSEAGSDDQMAVWEYIDEGSDDSTGDEDEGAGEEKAKNTCRDLRLRYDMDTKYSEDDREDSDEDDEEESDQDSSWDSWAFNDNTENKVEDGNEDVKLVDKEDDVDEDFIWEDSEEEESDAVSPKLQAEHPW